MNVKIRALALLASSAMLAAPAAALAEGPTYAPEKPQPTHPTHPLPGPSAAPGELAKAYGARCKGFSKKHQKGVAGTPFSSCVRAMAVAATTTKTTKAACKGLRKEHVAGQAGTEFSRCVVAAAKVKREAAAS
jgi:hypothetical protein